MPQLGRAAPLLALGRRRHLPAVLASRLRQPLPSETRLERRDQVGRRGSGLNFEPLDVLTRDLLFDRLQDPLPVLVLVVLWMELGPGQLADQPLGERPLLVADRRLGAPVDLGRVVDLAREVEPLEEESLLVPRIAIGVVLPRQVNVPTATRCVFSSAWTSTR